MSRYFSLLSLFLCCFLVVACGRETPADENESVEAVREETIEAQGELEQLNREVKQQGREQAQELLERVEENQ